MKRVSIVAPCATTCAKKLREFASSKSARGPCVSTRPGRRRGPRTSFKPTLGTGTKARYRKQHEKSTPRHPPPLNQLFTAFQLCPTKSAPTPNFASRFARPCEGSILSGSAQMGSRPCATPTKPVSPSCSPYSRRTRTRSSLRAHNENELEFTNHFHERARSQRRGGGQCCAAGQTAGRNTIVHAIKARRARWMFCCSSSERQKGSPNGIRPVAPRVCNFMPALPRIAAPLPW